MATTKEFLSMVINMCNMWGFSYMPIDNGMVDYKNCHLGTNHHLVTITKQH